jgi:potassium-transporting ATPase KdpC subunit
MNRLPGIVRQHIAALRLLLIFTVITGIIYPVFMWGVAEAAFSKQANGSMVTYHGRVVGSSLLCQEFVYPNGNPMPEYFQPRPSDASPTPTPKDDYGCDPSYSSASNLGPNNPVLVKLIRQREAQISAFDHVPVSEIPPDAVTASGSGLDPDISPAYADIQVDRVAAARHASPSAVLALVKQNTSGRDLGFLGEPGVNVLTLNIALDEKYPVAGQNVAGQGVDG